MLNKEAQIAKINREIELVNELSFGTCLLNADENTEEEIENYIDAYQYMWANTIATTSLDEFKTESGLEVIAKMKRDDMVSGFNRQITRMCAGMSPVYFHDADKDQIRKHENYSFIVNAIDALKAGVPYEDILA